MSTSEAHEWVGRTLADRYLVISTLGAGGMGTVFKATDTRLGADVVIKAPHPLMIKDAAFASRFSLEIQSLVKLSHPNIVKVMDVGECDGLPFAVMQFLAGGSLEERQSPCAHEDVAAWLPDIADALDFMHAEGMIHRDIKPGNVLFDSSGRAFLGDFGIAKVMADGQDSSDSNLTGTGTLIGTAEYMAPEMLIPSAYQETYDERADQYSLAVTVYEMLAGRPPFRGESMAEVAILLATKQPTPLHQRLPEIPENVSLVVAQALLKQPGKRFKDCRAFARAYLSVLGDAVGSPGPSPSPVSQQTTASTGGSRHVTQIEQPVSSGRPIPRVPTQQQSVPVTGSSQTKDQDVPIPAEPIFSEPQSESGQPSPKGTIAPPPPPTRAGKKHVSAKRKTSSSVAQTSTAAGAKTPARQKVSSSGAKPDADQTKSRTKNGGMIIGGFLVMSVAAVVSVVLINDSLRQELSSFFADVAMGAVEENDGDSVAVIPSPRPDDDETESLEVLSIPDPPGEPNQQKDIEPSVKAEASPAEPDMSKDSSIPEGPPWVEPAEMVQRREEARKLWVKRKLEVLEQINTVRSLVNAKKKARLQLREKRVAEQEPKPRAKQRLEFSDKRLNSKRAEDRSEAISRIKTTVGYACAVDYLMERLSAVEDYPPNQRKLCFALGRSQDPKPITMLFNFRKAVVKQRLGRFPGVTIARRKQYEKWARDIERTVDIALTNLLQPEVLAIEGAADQKAVILQLMTSGDDVQKKLCEAETAKRMPYWAEARGLEALPEILEFRQKHTDFKSLVAVGIDATIAALEIGLVEDAPAAIRAAWDIYRNDPDKQCRQKVEEVLAQGLLIITLEDRRSALELLPLIRGAGVEMPLLQRLQKPTELLVEMASVDEDLAHRKSLERVLSDDPVKSVRAAASRGISEMLAGYTASQGIDAYPILREIKRTEGEVSETAVAALKVLAPLPGRADEWVDQLDHVRLLASGKPVVIEQKVLPLEVADTALVLKVVDRYTMYLKVEFAERVTENEKEKVVRFEGGPTRGIDADDDIDTPPFLIVGKFRPVTAIDGQETVLLAVPPEVVESRPLTFHQFFKLIPKKTTPSALGL